MYITVIPRSTFVSCNIFCFFFLHKILKCKNGIRKVLSITGRLSKNSFIFLGSEETALRINETKGVV